MSQYNPSLLIMAKTLGFGYLNTTTILKVDNQGSPATSEEEDGAAYAEGTPPPQEQELIQILDELSPVKKPRTKLNETQKPFAYQEEGLKNLAAVWEHCDKQDIETYKDWYKQANADCQALAVELKNEIAQINPPDPIRMIVGVVAATSQGTLWEENIALARSVIQGRDISKFKVKKAGEKIDDESGELKITDNNLAKVKRILAGDFTALETDKFGAFFASIEKPELTQNTVVVDTHAAGMWLGKRLGVQDPMMQQNRPEGARLAAMVRDYRKLAGKVGYSPQSVQAVTWSVWRKLPPNYETEYMKYDEKHPEVEMFKAFYPFLYATLPNPKTGKQGKKANWRWRFSRFNDILRPPEMSKDEWDFVKDEYKHLMPHHSPKEWYDAVKKFGKNLDQYYGFPHDAWVAFIKQYPKFAGDLDQVKNTETAAVMEAAARRIAISELTR